MFGRKKLAAPVFIPGLISSLILCLAASAAIAQTTHSEQVGPRVDVAVNYSYMRANAAPGSCGCFSLNGGSTEGAVHVYRDLSAVFDLTGVYASTTSSAGQSLALVTYTGGPRFSYPLRRGQMVPFAQGLVGVVHGFDGQFPAASSTLSSSANALAVLVGGGLDVELNHRIAVRAVQVDYGLNHLPNNANNNENLLHVSVGVVFHVH